MPPGDSPVTLGDASRKQRVSVNPTNYQTRAISATEQHVAKYKSATLVVNVEVVGHHAKTKSAPGQLHRMQAILTTLSRAPLTVKFGLAVILLNPVSVICSSATTSDWCSAWQTISW